MSEKRVYLSSTEAEDLDYYIKWSKDLEYNHLLMRGLNYPRNRQEMMKWFRLDGEAPTDFFSFSIRTREEDVIIGSIGIKDVKWNHQSAGIYIGIGEPAFRGKGYGREAMELAMEFVFEDLNLYRLQLEVFEYNPAAIRLYEKLGFVKEGTLRSALYKDGQRQQELVYGLLLPEWQALYRAQA
ncbi:GNAT family protein [Anaerolineales bacterium]